MFAALPQPLEVEEVGRSFLEGLAGPALIAGAAIVAAFVAAWVARHNHAEQLASDRALRDLDHARQAVSSAVDKLAEAMDALSGAATSRWAASDALSHYEQVKHVTDAAMPTRRRDETGVPVDTRSDEEVAAVPVEILRRENDVLAAERNALKRSNEAHDKAHDDRISAAAAVAGLNADTFRLRIAIGPTSPVAEQHFVIVDAFQDFLDGLAPDDDGLHRVNPRPEEEVQGIADQLSEFVGLCSQWSAERETTILRSSWLRRVTRRVTNRGNLTVTERT